MRDMNKTVKTKFKLNSFTQDLIWILWGWTWEIGIFEGTTGLYCTIYTMYVLLKLFSSTLFTLLFVDLISRQVNLVKIYMFECGLFEIWWVGHKVSSNSGMTLVLNWFLHNSYWSEIVESGFHSVPAWIYMLNTISAVK